MVFWGSYKSGTTEAGDKGNEEKLVSGLSEEHSVSEEPGKPTCCDVHRQMVAGPKQKRIASKCGWGNGHRALEMEGWERGLETGS